MTMLLLNARNLLRSVPLWFPDSADELVVLSASRAVQGMSPEDQRELADRYLHLEIMEDYRTDRLVGRAMEVCREFGVTRILTVSETDILRAAEMRRDLGLPGQQVESAIAYRDKFVMKTIAAAAGIPVTPMRPVGSWPELLEAAEEFGYPLVIKRRDGRASTDQWVLQGEKELRGLTGLWGESDSGSAYLAEKWVSGHKLNVNGLMRDGEVVQQSPCRYLHSPWETRNSNRHAAMGMLPPEDPLYGRLCQMTAGVIAALPAPPGMCPFHAEFFLDDRGELVFCEIACRVGGLRIVDAYGLSFGVNLYEAGLKGQAGRSNEVGLRESGERIGMATFVPQQGVLRSIPSSCPLPQAFDYRVMGSIGRGYVGSNTSSDEIASVLLRQEDPDCLAELWEATNWWDGVVSWEK